jgi:hypothetical protein
MLAENFKNSICKPATDLDKKKIVPDILVQWLELNISSVLWKNLLQTGD